MLDQIYIAGGHLGGGGGTGNDGSDEGWWRWVGAAGRQAAASAAKVWRGVGEEEAVCRGIGFGRSLLHSKYLFIV